MLVAVGHWWTLDKCCSWWTQSWRGPEASKLSLASEEGEAGCTQWRAPDCTHSSPLLIERQRDVGVKRSCRERSKSQRDLEQGTNVCQSFWQAEAGGILVSVANEQLTHLTYVIQPFTSAK